MAGPRGVALLVGARSLDDAVESRVADVGLLPQHIKQSTTRLRSEITRRPRWRPGRALLRPVVQGFRSQVERGPRPLPQWASRMVEASVVEEQRPMKDERQQLDASAPGGCSLHRCRISTEGIHQVEDFRIV